uniref:Uncharacterized protein n=1 Tax=Tetradesmus obliquus TaxID=3088 RepID=A0A383WNP2_TETOB|eukprot:jgi/Sobl393_1/5277/SZX79077.1
MAKTACVSTVIVLALLLSSEAAAAFERPSAERATLANAQTIGNRRLLGGKVSITINKGAAKKTKAVVVSHLHSLKLHPFKKFSKFG